MIEFTMSRRLWVQPFERFAAIFCYVLNALRRALGISRFRARGRWLRPNWLEQGTAVAQSGDSGRRSALLFCGVSGLERRLRRGLFARQLAGGSISMFRRVLTFRDPFVVQSRREGKAVPVAEFILPKLSSSRSQPIIVIWQMSSSP
jgi:hypothetical protein